VTRVRRLPILLLVGALLVAAVVFRDRDDASDDGTAGAATTAEAGLPPADALSASWFCAEGTSAPDGRAAETIVISSVADRAITATVTVMPGGDAAPVSSPVEVPARQEVRVDVADILETPEPGVVVEVVGGQAAVAHEIRGQSDVAAEPCARRAATDWYFAAGTTVRGTQQFLALFDPFGDDAIVDVSFLTDTGVQEPAGLQGLVVPRRSRVSVPVHDFVQRQQVVAIHVHARSGRVVAERSMTFDGTTPDEAPARQGIALALGATRPERTWSLPFGTTDDGGVALVGVANFGPVASNVEVEVILPGDETLSPVSVPVPARAVVTVDVSERVPAGTRFTVRALARTVEGHEAPLVVEILQWWAESSSSTAVASSVGSSGAARRWVVPVPRDAADGAVAVLNPGSEPVTAELLVYDDGDEPPSAPAAAIPPGRFATFALGSLDGGPRVVVVSADHPVVAGLTLVGGAGGSMMTSVPDFSSGEPA
jgi:hypothetical protein